MVETRVNIGRIELAYKEWGNTSGTPLIQLHGWLDNANSFDNMNPHLDLNRFHVFALDFPGHGASDHRSMSENYHLLEYVQDCEAFARVMKLPKIGVVGHSLGGVVGSLWAAAVPERVERLFLIDALGPIASKEENIASQLGSAIDKILATPRAAPVYTTPEEAISARKLGMGNLTEESIRILLERGLNEEAGGYTWRSDRRLRHASLMRLSESQVHAFLAAITCPVYGVFANKGLLASSPHFNSRAKIISDFRYEMLEGGHHLHLQECPRDVAQRVNRFFK